jgi:hypothetical protein
MPGRRTLVWSALVAAGLVSSPFLAPRATAAVAPTVQLTSATGGSTGAPVKAAFTPVLGAPTTTTTADSNGVSCSTTWPHSNTPDAAKVKIT